MFFKKYPFALPNLVSSLFFLVGLVVGFLFLKETLEARKHRRDYGRIIGKLLLRPLQRKIPVTLQRSREETASLLTHSRSSTFTSNGRAKGNREGKDIRGTPTRFREVSLSKPLYVKLGKVGWMFPVAYSAYYSGPYRLIVLWRCSQ